MWNTWKIRKSNEEEIKSYPQSQKPRVAAPLIVFSLWECCGLEDLAWKRQGSRKGVGEYSKGRGAVWGRHFFSPLCLIETLVSRNTRALLPTFSFFPGIPNMTEQGQ